MVYVLTLIPTRYKLSNLLKPLLSLRYSLNQWHDRYNQLYFICINGIYFYLCFKQYVCLYISISLKTDYQ